MDDLTQVNRRGAQTGNQMRIDRKQNKRIEKLLSRHFDILKIQRDVDGPTSST